MRHVLGALCATMLALPAHASPPSADHGANVVLVEVSPDGCAYTSLNLTVGNVTAHDPVTGWVTSQALDVFSTTRDLCTGQFFWWNVVGDDVVYSGDLDGASIVGTVTLEDAASGTTRDVAFDLTLTAVGETAREGLLTIVHSMGSHTKAQLRSASRDAAVAGTVDGVAADVRYAVLYEDVSHNHNR